MICVFWLNQQMDQLLKPTLKEKQQLAQGKIADSAQLDAVKKQVSENLVKGTDQNEFQQHQPGMMPMEPEMMEMEQVEQQPGHEGNQAFGDDTF